MKSCDCIAQRLVPTSPTHVLDFGPDLGAAVLTSRLVEGTGAQVIVATLKHREIHPPSLAHARCYGLTDLLKNGSDPVLSYAAKFGARLDAENRIHNAFTQRLGKPPVMIAGMTPTTSLNGINLVAAATTAGFHCELAAGGFSSTSTVQRCSE